jgi:LytS/YehU family sensor histidine kinase
LISTPLWDRLCVIIPDMRMPPESAIDFGSRYFRAILFGGLLTAVLFLATRERCAAAALHASRLKQVDLERQMTEARLQVLQAQIEPHFLFNTLATVKRLYQVDVAAGRRMLRGLASYLTGAIAQMRGERSTLGGELEMVRGYLDVIKVRMEERLQVAVDVASDLHGERIPPMMVATLVENAVKHGINPRPSGGTVRISAKRVDSRLRIEVSDDGMGFDKSSGFGVGLANTRARLATLFGDDARLSIRSRAGGGTTAAIELPSTCAERTA